MDEVIKENNQLKEAEAKAARIEVTGRANGTIYATGDIRQGKPGGQGERWLVEMTQHEDFLLSDISDIQISLGGIPLLQDGDLLKWECGVLDFIQGCYDEEDGYGLFEFLPRQVNCPSIGTVSTRCGPFNEYDEYSRVDEGHNMGDNPFVGTHMAMLGILHREMTGRIERVDFKLPPMLNCLERFGITEEKATHIDPTFPVRPVEQFIDEFYGNRDNNGGN